MVDAYLGIGSNTGDRDANLRRAVSGLERFPATAVVARSAVYESAPMGRLKQSHYLNGAVRLNTRLHPAALLKLTQSLERRLGRRKSSLRWGPRALDLDILVYGCEQVFLPHLTIPHPGIPDRSFVLMPLMDLNPRLNIPNMGRVRDLLSKLQGPRARRVRLRL